MLFLLQYPLPFCKRRGGSDRRGRADRMSALGRPGPWMGRGCRPRKGATDEGTAFADRRKRRLERGRFLGPPSLATQRRWGAGGATEHPFHQNGLSQTLNHPNSRAGRPCHNHQSRHVFIIPGRPLGRTRNPGSWGKRHFVTLQVPSWIPAFAGMTTLKRLSTVHDASCRRPDISH